MYFLTFCCFCDHHYMCILYNLQCSYLCCLFRNKLPEIKVISLKCEVLGWYTKTSHFKTNYFNYRQDGREAAIAGIKIYSGPPKKSAFSPRRGDSFHRFTSNLAQPRGTWVHLAVQYFVTGARGGNAPLNVENFNFLVKSRPTSANSWTDFYYC